MGREATRNRDAKQATQAAWDAGEPLAIPETLTYKLRGAYIIAVDRKEQAEQAVRAYVNLVTSFLEVKDVRVDKAVVDAVTQGRVKIDFSECTIALIVPSGPETPEPEQP